MLDKIAEKLFDLLWPKIQDIITEQMKKLGPVIAEKLLAMLPVISAATAKIIVEQIGQHLPGINLGAIPSVGDLSKVVQDQIIKDPDLPWFSDNVFDLSEFLGGVLGKK